jgi:hypothetical protein
MRRLCALRSIPSEAGGAQPATEIPELMRLERREWQLWSLAILAILWLTLGTLLTPLADWFGLEGFPLRGEAGISIYHLGMVLLMLFFCLFLVRSQRVARALRAKILASWSEMHQMALDMEGLRSLLKVTASITSEMDLSALLHLIAKEAVTTLKAHQSSLMMLGRGRTVLRTVATHGTDKDEVRNARVRLGEGVAGWVAQTGKPRLLQGRPDTGEFFNLTTKDPPITSALCVPLQIQDRTMGVLNVSLLHAERQFTDNDLRVLMIYANHAAVAIRNAALLKGSQKKPS